MASRRTLLLAGGVALLAAAVGVGLLTVSGDAVPSGTSVAGVDLGGLDRAAAERAVRALDLPASVRLSADGEALTLPVAGLAVDAAKSVDGALRAGPLDRLRALLGAGRALPLRTSVDQRALTASLQALAEGFDRPVREGAIRFTAAPVPVPVPPRTGRALDVAAAARAVQAAWPSPSPIEVPVALQRPANTPEQVTTLLTAFATPAVAAPVTVTAAGGSVRVEPLDIAKALRIETVGRTLQPRLDEAVLYERVRPRLRRVGVPPVDATFRITAGKPVLVPARNGTAVSARDLAAAVLGVLADAAPRTAAAPLSPAAARVSTVRARGLGVVEQIGTFTTNHPCCKPRVQNIQRIADLVDGYVVLPGERFDLNAVVGPRDTARGFVLAPQILEGEFVDRVGGGVSQFATTLFNAVFFSGLKDVAHTPHSYYITRYPPGREATVSFPKPDLIFENDSPNGVLITTSYTGTSITVTLWGTRRFDEVRSETGPRTRLREFSTQYVTRSDCTATAGQRGFDIVVTRVFVQGGKPVRRESFRTRYKPEPRFVCGPPPA